MPLVYALSVLSRMPPEWTCRQHMDTIFCWSDPARDELAHLEICHWLSVAGDKRGRDVSLLDPFPGKCE